MLDIWSRDVDIQARELILNIWAIILQFPANVYLLRIETNCQGGMREYLMSQIILFLNNTIWLRN